MLLRILFVATLFFPLLHNEPAHQPVEIEQVQSVSTLLQVSGVGCNLNYKIIGQPYTIPSTLYIWSEGECEPEEFFVTTGFWWADFVCSGYNCVEVSYP